VRSTNLGGRGDLEVLDGVLAPHRDAVGWLLVLGSGLPQQIAAGQRELGEVRGVRKGKGKGERCSEKQEAVGGLVPAVNTVGEQEALCQMASDVAMVPRDEVDLLLRPTRRRCRNTHHS
jgi:hypothetical protein